MKEFPVISEQIRREQEDHNEKIILNNNNLLILLFFANDFKKSVAEHAGTLNADVTAVTAAARTLQGYGYIYINFGDGKNELIITERGINLIGKLRSNLKERH